MKSTALTWLVITLSIGLAMCYAYKPRVIDGEEDSKGEFPYAVALCLKEPIWKKGVLVHHRTCSGSLIAPQWVLTAGHCTDNTPKTLFPTRIQYGNMALLPNNSAATYSNIIKNYLHPGYSNRYYMRNSYPRNDLALTLVEKVHLKSYGRVSSVDYFTMIGLPVRYVRLTNLESNDESTIPLQIGEAMVSPCWKKILTGPLICAVRKCGKKEQLFNRTDSGVPLIHDGRIAGVLSSYTKTNPAYEKHFTPVSPFLDWIESVTGSNVNN